MAGRKITSFIETALIGLLGSAVGMMRCEAQDLQDELRNQIELRRIFKRPFGVPFRGQKSGRSQPLSQLPSHLFYPGEGVSLVADFSGAKESKVPVYLINSSKESFPIEWVAYELPIVLEAHLGYGHWERAETRNSAGFLFSTRNGEIFPGYFRVKESRCWKTGEDALLRYALYQNGKAVIASEPFEGKLPLGEIDKARHDLMSASIVPASLQIRYRPGKTRIDEVASEWIDRLTLLRSFGPCYVDLGHAQKWAGDIHENPVATRRERDVAVALQMQMLQPWPAQYDLIRLHRRCEEILVEGEGTSGVRQKCWQVLTQYAERSPEVDHVDWPGLAGHAWGVLFEENPGFEKEAAADFLCVKGIAENHSPLSSRGDNAALLHHPLPAVRIVAANAVLSRKQRQPVFDFYEVHHEDIGARELVKVLHFDRLYNTSETPNWILWERALDKDLEYTVPRLSIMFESDPTQTNLRKFPRNSVLPSNIRRRLETYCSVAGDSDGRKAVKRLLDNIVPGGNRFFLTPALRIQGEPFVDGE